MESDVADIKDKLAEELFNSIPVGVGSESLIATTRDQLEQVLTRGMDWSIEQVRMTRIGYHSIAGRLLRAVHLLLEYPIAAVRNIRAV